MSPKTILVTGASGFIAKHVVLHCLGAGHRVRASVRSPARQAEVTDALRPHLALADALDRLSFVNLDLDRDAGWRDALTGIDALLHTASPFPLSQPRDADDLIRPAVDGTLRALRAARDAGVERVVVTSSVASIMYAGFPGIRRPYTEADWTDGTLAALTPYTRSKALAERAAWDFVAREAPGMRLTAINPGLVLGEPLDDRYGTSLRVVERLLAGKDPAVPDVTFSLVDVADVARMHVRALDVPAAEGRRFLASGGTLTFAEMASVLRQAFPARKVVTRRAPSLLIRLLGLFDPSVRTILPDLGRRIEFSTEAARDVLGMQFADPRDVVVRSGRALVARGRA
jgi:dihydroflavonol-4-reductase